MLVPDEDLYEQGFWPSRFNDDHKWTFTISKRQSWSPVSVNVLDLVKTLDGGELVQVQLQDAGYDRSMCQWGRPDFWTRLGNIFRLVVGRLGGALIFQHREIRKAYKRPFDQTLFTIRPTLAQIQFIVKKN